MTCFAIQGIKLRADLSLGYVGDGQTFKHCLVLLTESTTGLFTKHLCGEERVHGKERPQHKGVYAGMSACVQLQLQHAQRQYVQAIDKRSQAADSPQLLLLMLLSVLLQCRCQVGVSATVNVTVSVLTAVTVSAIVSVPISVTFIDGVTVSASVHVTVNVSIRAIVVLTVSSTVIVTVRVTASVTVKFAVDAMRRVFGRHADRPNAFQSKTISRLKLRAELSQDMQATSKDLIFQGLKA